MNIRWLSGRDTIYSKKVREVVDASSREDHLVRSSYPEETLRSESSKAEVLDAEGNVIGVTRARGVSSHIDHSSTNWIASYQHVPALWNVNSPIQRWSLVGAGSVTKSL